MTVLLGLKSPEEMFRAQMEELNVTDVPGIEPSAPPPPLLPPKMCEKCGVPFVGDSCYFCPSAPSMEGP
jgi:hypothetical protein